ncbi:MAG: DUF3850 domain-containing protein [Methanosarcinales archaeon]|jgi:hypothetical protein|nr:DUF3850 domain-containing protein [Methanosarcinales archaeon]
MTPEELLSERLSGLHYRESFLLLETFAFQSLGLSDAHRFHVYKIQDSWFEEIRKGKRFEIRKDDRKSVPVEGDAVCLKSQSKGSMIVRVVYTLLHTEAPDFVKDGFFIFGFEIACEVGVHFKARGVSEYIDGMLGEFDEVVK